jgi:hypothetical protein
MPLAMTGELAAHVDLHFLVNKHSGGPQFSAERLYVFSEG